MSGGCDTGLAGLFEAFPAISADKIRQVYESCARDGASAAEELLSIQFLEEQGTMTGASKRATRGTSKRQRSTSHQLTSLAALQKRRKVTSKAQPSASALDVQENSTKKEVLSMREKPALLFAGDDTSDGDEDSDDVEVRRLSSSSSEDENRGSRAVVDGGLFDHSSESLKPSTRFVGVSSSSEEDKAEFFARKSKKGVKRKDFRGSAAGRIQGEKKSKKTTPAMVRGTALQRVPSSRKRADKVISPPKKKGLKKVRTPPKYFNPAISSDEEDDNDVDFVDQEKGAEEDIERGKEDEDDSDSNHDDEPIYRNYGSKAYVRDSDAEIQQLTAQHSQADNQDDREDFVFGVPSMSYIELSSSESPVNTREGADADQGFTIGGASKNSKEQQIDSTAVTPSGFMRSHDLITSSEDYPLTRVFLDTPTRNEKTFLSSSSADTRTPPVRSRPSSAALGASSRCSSVSATPSQISLSSSTSSTSVLLKKDSSTHLSSSSASSNHQNFFSSTSAPSKSSVSSSTDPKGDEGLNARRKFFGMFKDLFSLNDGTESKKRKVLRELENGIYRSIDTAQFKKGYLKEYQSEAFRIYRSLKNNPVLRADLVLRKIDPGSVAKMSVDELAPPELRKEREELRQKTIQDLVLEEEPVEYTLKTKNHVIRVKKADSDVGNAPPAVPPAPALPLPASSASPSETKVLHPILKMPSGSAGK